MSTEQLLEDVAQWLEQRAPYLQAAEAAGLAARIRNGQWNEDKPRRTDADVLVASANRKLARGAGFHALSEAEFIAYGVQHLARPERTETP
jgi:hypothetical protein